MKGELQRKGRCTSPREEESAKGRCIQGTGRKGAKGRESAFNEGKGRERKGMREAPREREQHIAKGRAVKGGRVG